MNSVVKNMKQTQKQSGFTLVELLVAMSIIVIVGAISLVSINAIMDSFDSSSYAISMIDAALSGARATAIKEGKYAGIRFQREYDPAGFDKASQYMIPIILPNVNDMNKTKDCYVAVKGKRPAKIPDSLIVMETYRYDYSQSPVTDIMVGDDELKDTQGVRNATSFVVLFTPSGKTVIRFAQVRNSDGEENPSDSSDSSDRIFNSEINVRANVGRFYQDYKKGGTDEIPGLWKEPTRDSFYVLNREDFEKVDPSKRYTDFLVDVKDASTYYLNPYNGKIIREKE